MDLSQNGEATVVANWFGDYKGTLLSIGENDGQTLSNAYGLISEGWSACVVEPAPKAFALLQGLHALNERVYCINVAVGRENKDVLLWDSGTHLNNGDTSLLSTTVEKDYKKWKATTEFRVVSVPMVTFDKLQEESPYKTYDFVTIDAEGNDLLILEQMNLTNLGVKAICIEHNGDEVTLLMIKAYCAEHGLSKELLRNAENIILTI